MADATYQTKVYNAQGGGGIVVAASGTIKVETGGAIVPNSGTQASAIANATGATYGTGEEAKINAIIAALEGVGILGT